MRFKEFLNKSTKSIVKLLLVTALITLFILSSKYDNTAKSLLVGSSLAIIIGSQFLGKRGKNWVVNLSLFVVVFVLSALIGYNVQQSFGYDLSPTILPGVLFTFFATYVMYDLLNKQANKLVVFFNCMVYNVITIVLMIGTDVSNRLSLIAIIGAVLLVEFFFEKRYFTR